MKPIRHILPVAIAITFALAAPAFAQHDQESRAASEARGARPREGEARGQARARRESPRATTSNQDQGRAVQGGPENRGGVGREDRAAPRVDTNRARDYALPRAYGYSRPYLGVPIVRYARPYYMFRPRFPIGFGIYVGYPVPYPMMYGYPGYVYGYGYGNAPAYGAMQPPLGSYGGISFDIAPDDAAVWVDGQYVGVARDFSPWYQPLTVTPGRHRIELQAAGMAPLLFDVDVTPGQVLPYRGTLQPY